MTKYFKSKTEPNTYYAGYNAGIYGEFFEMHLEIEASYRGIYNLCDMMYQCKIEDSPIEITGEEFEKAYDEIRAELRNRSEMKYKIVYLDSLFNNDDQERVSVYIVKTDSFFVPFTIIERAREDTGEYIYEYGELQCNTNSKIPIDKIVDSIMNVDRELKWVNYGRI